MNIEERASAILVSIEIPGMDLQPENPAWLINGFAGGVLKDLLTIELDAKGLLTERPEGGMMPFLGRFLFEVNDAHAAGAAVHTVLLRNGLDTWATIFRYDPDEMIWRSIYPRGSMKLTDAFVAEGMASAAKVADVVALWKQALHGSSSSNDNAIPG